MRSVSSVSWQMICGLAVLTAVGCSMSDRPAESLTAKKLDTVNADLRDRATAAKEDLFSRLSGRLMQVLQDQGPAAAFSICSQEAPKFAEAVSKERNLRIGRTSLKLRNPSNTPPEWAKAQIDSKPSEPEFVDLGNDKVGALLPIRLQATCLLCHGPEETISDDVKTELAKFYPRDQAIGYREGDIRGWFWLELPISK